MVIRIQDDNQICLTFQFYIPSQCDSHIASITSFFNKLKRKFDESDLLLTCTISIPSNFDAKHCDLVALSKTVEFIILLQSYEKMDNFDEVYKEADAFKLLSISNVQNNIEELIDSGVPPSKIIAGILLDGPTFKATSDGESKFDGLIKYNEMCKENKSDINGKTNWKQYDGGFDSSVLSKSDDQYNVVIENTRSIANKVRFTIKKGLAGIAAFNIQYDDFEGYCFIPRDTFDDFKTESVTLTFPKRTDPTFPLLRTINEAIDVALDELNLERKSTSPSKTTETVPEITTPKTTALLESFPNSDQSPIHSTQNLGSQSSMTGSASRSNIAMAFLLFGSHFLWYLCHLVR